MSKLLSMLNDETIQNIIGNNIWYYYLLVYIR